MVLTVDCHLCLIGDKQVDGFEAERKKLLAQLAVRKSNYLLLLRIGSYVLFS